MATERGIGAVFYEGNVMSYLSGDKIVSYSFNLSGSHFLIVTSNGLGNLIEIDKIPLSKNKGMGCIFAKINNRTGPVVAVLPVNIGDDVVFETKFREIKINTKDIPIMERPSQGVILVRLNHGESVENVFYSVFS